MRSSRAKVIRRLIAELRHYWREYPDAADSIEGIRCWWLYGDNLSSDDVELALKIMLDRREIVAIWRAERIIYSWNKLEFTTAGDIAMQRAH